MNTPLTRRGAIVLATALAGLQFAAVSSSAQTYPNVGANNDRVVELVSTNKIGVPLFSGVLSADGDRALYVLNGGTDDTTNGAQAVLVAERTATGWKARSALPSQTAAGAPATQLLARTPDLRRILFLARPKLGSAGDLTVISYSPDTGDLFRGRPLSSRSFFLQFSSDDLKHTIGVAREPLAAGDPAGGGLYDLGSGVPVLIGLMPNDEPPPCGLGEYGFIDTTNASDSQHWVSEDGRRVFFHTIGAGNCFSDPGNLYMREGGASGFTRLISGPATAGPNLGGRFSRATPDGSKVFFTTTTQLDERDSNLGNDVYRYTVGEGNRCLTCAVPDAQVMTLAPPPAGSGPEQIVVAENGERLYFTSNSVLAAGASPGAINLYVWRNSNPEQIDFVGPASGLTASGRVNSVTTPDGAVLIFRSDNPALNARTGSDNRGFSQFYRYDDRTKALACMTCAPGGATREAGTELDQPGLPLLSAPSVLSDDGRSFVFSTGEALVAEDTNLAGDVYEWRDGKLGLITGGRTPDLPQVLQISPDGRSVLFMSFGALAPGGLDLSRQLYVARIGGGFPAPRERPQCEGDACQGLPSRPEAEHARRLGREGNSVPERRAAFALGAAIGRSQLLSLAKGRAMRVAVVVNRPGRVRASLGANGTTAVGTARHAGTVWLSVRLDRSARQALASKRRLKVTLSISFSGVSDPIVRKLSLRRAK